MAKLNGRPLISTEGDLNISLTKPLISVKEFAKEALSKHPVIIVLRQVTPNSATFTQGNFCGGACSNNISAGGLSELSMKLQSILQSSVGPTGQPISVRRFAAFWIGQWPVPPRLELSVGPTGLMLSGGPHGERLQRLQVFAWLEPNSLSWRDIHFRTGTRIPADAGLPRLDRKYAEAAQLDPIVSLEGIFHTVKDRIHRLFRFCLAHSRPLYDLIHEIEFNHWNLRFRLKPTTTIC